MAVTFTSLESAVSNVNASSYTTGSVTPTATSYLFIDNRIATGVSGGPQTPAVTGGGLAWTVVRTQLIYNVSTPNRRLTLFVGIGVPSTGTLAISLNGETQTHCGWQIIGTTAAFGQPVVVQSTGVNDGGVLGTTGTITVANPITQLDNVTLACILVTSAPVSLVVGTGYTAVGSGYAETTDGTTGQAERKTNAQTATATWTGNNSWMMIAAEIQDNNPTPSISGELRRHKEPRA